MPKSPKKRTAQIVPRQASTKKHASIVKKIPPTILVTGGTGFLGAHLVRQLVEAGAKTIVLSSSSGTIAVTEKGDLTPDETYPPPLDIIARWPYYASKAYQEMAALERFHGQGLRLVILNPSLLLGPGDERLSSTKVVLDFMARKIAAVPNGGLSFVDVRDTAQGFMAAMKKSRPGQSYLRGEVNWNFGKI